jgi:hypothetical protein
VSSKIWWLRDAAGVRRRVRPGGVLIGRSADCDIVLVEPEVSRHHALVYLEAGTPTIVVLGTGHVRVDGKDVGEPQALHAGATVDVASLSLHVDVDDEAAEAPKFLLQLIRGGAYPVAGATFSIGGGVDDDLQLEALPAGAVVLEPHEGFLSVEASVEGIRVAGREVQPGELGSLRDGSTIKTGDITLRVVAVGGESTAATRQAFDVPEGPIEVRLVKLPRGGRLHLGFEERDADVYVAERRCALLLALLQPEGKRAGEFIEDPEVLAHVWPGESRTRTHLNTLIHRTRRDLIDAGLDGPALVERAEGGGATRFAVSELARIHVEGF